jgi:hypothetical protein
MAHLPTNWGADPRAARPVRRPRYASRGQALIIAVLVMFILAGLAGVFIALINFAIVQTATAEERTKLEAIVKAGLEQAKSELLHNSDGYDWRPPLGPDVNNPGWHFNNGGFYRIKVRYGPAMIFGADAANPGYANPTGINDLKADAGYHFLDNPMDRYLQISVDAQFALDNPPDQNLRQADESTYNTYRNGFLNPRRFIERHLTAYMPIGITDYCRWITNVAGDTEPVVLAPPVTLEPFTTVKVNPDTAPDVDLQNALNQTLVSSATALTIFEGPIRAEGDLDIGQAAVYVTNSAEGAADSYASNFHVRRRDLVEIAGKLQAYDKAAMMRKLLVNMQNRALDATPANTSEANVDVLNLKGSATVLRYLQTFQNNPLIRRLRAPNLAASHPVTGLSRYAALTAYSGEWLQGSALNTGMLGQGEGLYIANDDMDPYQGQGDLDSLRGQWLDCSAENWEHGLYDPGRYAIEVTLNDWGVGTAQVNHLPYITLRDRTGKKRFTDARGVPTNTVDVAYPRNGVIYAPGNLIVKGSLPASLAYTGQKNADGTHTYLPAYDDNYYARGRQLPGGWHVDDAAKRPRIDYYVSPTNRRYDLSIVSGGTIYIEGNLLGPATRTENAVAPNTPIVRGSEYDSKLALLAMDNVCLNPTATVKVSTNLLTGGIAPNAYFWAFNQNPITVTFSTARTVRPRTSLLLRHAGQWTNANDVAYLRMRVNGGAEYRWNNLPAAQLPTGMDNTDLIFATRDRLADLFPTAPPAILTTTLFPDESGRTANNGFGSWGGGLFGNNVDPFNAQVWNLTDPVHVTTPLNDYGGLNVLELAWQQGTPYLCMADLDNGGPTVTGIDLQVDALIYAQRGSWFIIPGTYYNNDPASTLPAPFPQYHEPLDVTITVNGAIAENRPAPVAAEEAWTQHWRGANVHYYTDPTATATVDASANPAKTFMQWDPGRESTSWDPNTWRWTKRRMGIVYQYDATLMRPVCFDVFPNDSSVYYRPRLPKLPACPDVFSLGEMRNG